MALRSRSLGLLAAAMILGLAVTPSEAGAAPATGRPTLGSCHRYGVDQLADRSEARPDVSCSDPHTAVTVAVVHVPRGIDITDMTAVFDAVGTQCYRGMYDALGRNAVTRARSAYLLSFFTPTRSQRDAGARWARCDTYLSGGDRIQLLPDPLLPAGPLGDDVARCLTGHHKIATVCARDHVWRATGTVRVRETYPSETRFARIGARRCGSRTSTTLTYSTWPSTYAWKAGNKVLTCYSRIAD